MNLRVPYYHLKASLKKRSTWMVIISLCLLILIFKDISLPDNKNVTVGVVLNENIESQKILENINSIYSFNIYDDEDSLKQDVKNGTLECGFIFDKSFDDKVNKGRIKNLVEYVYSPYTTKGAVIKETIYSAFLKDYSNLMLSDSIGDVFGSDYDGETTKQIEKSLHDKNAYYIDSNDIFTVDFNSDFK